MNGFGSCDGAFWPRGRREYGQNDVPQERPNYTISPTLNPIINIEYSIDGQSR